MQREEQDDDLGNYWMPVRNERGEQGDANSSNSRSQRLGQQRVDFNISPPTIPRSDTANIFPGGRASFTSTSASGPFQPFNSTNWTTQFPLQQSAQGQIPSYSQGNLSSHQQHEEAPSNLRWQSRIIPQTHFAGSRREHYFTPLHSTSNEESKFPASINPASPVGVNSPAGFVNLMSPMQQQHASELSRQQTTTPLPPAQLSAERPPSVPTVGLAASESSDSGMRMRQRRNRRTPTQRKARTPSIQHDSRGVCVPVDSKSPPPQNLRGDPFRSAKVKTELCRNFMTPQGCPFGDKCNYAHGVHELKYTKLMDLERAGLVDIEIFRTHPCPTWISTGSCPFDQRCIGIHDTRVGGHPATPAWLPHAETLINKIGKGKNIDKFFHERLASMYNTCPVYGYVPKRSSNGVSLENDESAWRHFYDFICNSQRKPIEVQFDPTIHKIRNLSEEHKLEIVLKMRQRKSSQDFAYLPTHLFFGDLCMILQERTFVLVPPSQDSARKTSSSGSSSSSHSSTVTSNELNLREVSKDSKVSGNEVCFNAYEIAFGPVGDPTVRPPSVWFDVPNEDITPCTPQQAKHHKRSRHRIKKAPNRSNPVAIESLSGDKFKSLRISPFFIYQPIDHVTFDLITCILVHRLKKIKFLSGKFDNSFQQVSKILETEHHNLKRQYLSLYQFWVQSSWPEEEIESPINDNTDVPPVSMNYVCMVGSRTHFRSKECYGLASARHTFDLNNHSKMLPSILWKSFTTNMMLQHHGTNFEHIRRETTTQYDDFFKQLRRLPTLRHLSKGGSLCQNRFLPHVRTSRGVGPSSLSQCIEDLLGEWEELKAHYSDEKSESASPLHRVTSNEDQPSSKKGEIENVNLKRHLNQAAQMYTRIQF